MYTSVYSDSTYPWTVYINSLLSELVIWTQVYSVISSKYCLIDILRQPMISPPSTFSLIYTKLNHCPNKTPPEVVNLRNVRCWIEQAVCKGWEYMDHNILFWERRSISLMNDLRLHTCLGEHIFETKYGSAWFTARELQIFQIWTSLNFEDELLINILDFVYGTTPFLILVQKRSIEIPRFLYKSTVRQLKFR